MKRGFSKAAIPCLLLALLAGCDKAESEFKQAQKEEQFQYFQGAVKRYMDIVKNYPGSNAASQSADRLFVILFAKTKEFSALDDESRRVMEHFAQNLPDTRLGAESKRVFQKERVRGEIYGAYLKFFEKLSIEDYTGLEPYFAAGKVSDEIVEKLGRKGARNGLIVQGYRFVDVMPGAAEKADLIVARQEFFPENGSTAEVKYLVRLERGQSGWVISSLEAAPVHSIKAR